MEITFLNHTTTTAETEAYRRHAMSRYPTATRVLVDFDGDDAMLTYEMPPVPFERIRRITGYLVGTTDRFNDGKRAELHDREVHHVGNDIG